MANYTCAAALAALIADWAAAAAAAAAAVPKNPTVNFDLVSSIYSRLKM